MAWTERGAGDAVGVLHGGCDDSRSWRWQLDGLSDRWRVLAWDAPGCGRSDDPPPSWRLAEFADAAAAWLVEAGVGVDGAHVIGLSFGSSLAIELAVRHPALVRSLVLASAYAGWAGSLPADEVEARLSGVLAAAAAAAAAEPRADAEVDPPGAVPDVFGPDPAADLVRELGAVWADNDLSRRPAGCVAMARSMAEADLRPVLGDLGVPVLLVYGAHDRRSPVATVGRPLAAAIPRSRLAVLPDAGHVCNAEASEEFNAVVRAFLGTVEA